MEIISFGNDEFIMELYNCNYFDKSINNIMKCGLFEMAKYKILLTCIIQWFIQLLIQSWFISFKLSDTKKTYPDFKEKIG